MAFDLKAVPEQLRAMLERRLETLAAQGIPFEVVPGVSSVYSVPCYAGIPLTHRHYASSVTIVTGHDAPASGGRASPRAQTSLNPSEVRAREDARPPKQPFSNRL